MRIRTLSAVTASILAVGLMTGGAAAFAAAQEAPTPDQSTFVDGVPAPTDEADATSENEEGIFIDGEPAPLFVTPADLAKGPVTLVTGQSLIVVLDTENGGIFTGTGGTDDDAVVHFDAATVGADDDEASFNAGFSAEKAGATKGWIIGTDGQRITFDITVTDS
ncbi:MULTISPECIES: hypothetical protein [Microbacterium]|uniref:hypothetical protein n=1 Tax=Microbacterium TaxID=33882 RepID=UPI0027800EF0|nr:MULTISPECIES: hypothetical protein [Microbacterium]MDQ1085135.1 hypothetical protein [Microbacterium sp. SORGH_AS_0344]MDQ1169558.1 hypothetical protein [Microbacterium proteolyticum]